MLQKNKFGFYEISNKPTVDELASCYQDKYYQEARELNWSTPLQILIILTQDLAALIIWLTRTFLRHASVLDVGCGEGFALAYFAENKFEVSGLTSAMMVSLVRIPILLIVRDGRSFLLAQKKISHSKCDVILLQNELDPVALLQSIKELLEPAGLLITVLKFSLTQRVF